MNRDHFKLDNPIWYSLNETHKVFAIFSDNAAFYHYDYCPFGAFIGSNQISAALEGYATNVTDFYIVGEKPAESRELVLQFELVCEQMVLHQGISVIPTEKIVELGEVQQDDLLQLINLVQPGYFKSKTNQLGRYYGIYKSGELVAVAGERMKMNNYTEISAVVTHPNHTRMGYAKQLVAHASQQVFNENKVPFLHVAGSNSPAINLYKKLGFVARRTISFWNFAKNNSAVSTDKNQVQLRKLKKIPNAKNPSC